MTKTIREFHVSRKARDLYQFNDALFTLSGNVIFTNFLAARTFAQKMNQRRDLIRYPEQSVRAGALIAMGLIDEIMHYVVSIYIESFGKHVMAEALEHVENRLGHNDVEKALRQFTDEFPPVAVYQRKMTIDEYLLGETGDTPNRQIILEEMLQLWLANMNPAFSVFLELFDDTTLKKETAFLKVIAELRSFFDGQPPFGPESQNLIDMLRSPAITIPHSLAGQLEYIMERWGYLLGKFVSRMLKSLDLFKEEEKMPFLGPGKAEVYRYAGLEFEPEQFSPDKDWMPRLVLLAKNIYVWLDQLSKTYGRSISKLNEIPDEELDILQKRGFTGIWLIGVWERSAASQRIKQMCGNPEAVPSAYSLYDYIIADDLGGEDAFLDLKDRTTRRGIRLASDMVPNHVGIHSRWVIEHPDWFVALDQNPFPWYTYGGPDLSHDERVSIQIEDHYYDRTDAAVVFKRRDNWTGDEKFIYHGNDGTSMPWNDTAQLNYLNPEVREAMIRTILHVAGKFPVIRFDAAMTLTKKHYQRLWFPEAGGGGAIPTRTEHSLTYSEFSKAMPNEFWREVVDRVALEAPDTLLLAEAFWLLEGYFVRTLGMHRVYNSAFMNMLRDEENAKYRTVMKNTLEFDPQILRRFVNFMNNPDERTAVDQFGKSDKYFGVCTMMVTMPGLPMFGHGQIEGYTEKYGMEYRRAYWDEPPDRHLIERHQREIFPLLHRRYLFAGVEDFLLYDFFTPEGTVNEDVFAYSNRSGDEKTLFIFNNRYSSVKGWVHRSVAFSVREDSAEKRGLIQRDLGAGLGINPQAGHYMIFRDHVTNLEYIRSNRELAEKGLFVELGAYHYHVFIDFREIEDNEWQHFSQLCTYLDGRGVPDIDGTIRELFLQPIHRHFRELVNAPLFRYVLTTHKDLMNREILQPPQGLNDEVRGKLYNLLMEIKTFTASSGDENAVADEIAGKLKALITSHPFTEDITDSETDIHAVLFRELSASHLAWLFVHLLGGIVDGQAARDEISRSWIDEWLFGRIIGETLAEFGYDETEIYRSQVLVKIFTTHQSWCDEESPLAILTSFMNDSDVQHFLQVNRYQDVLWFSKEAFEDIIAWMHFTAGASIMSQKGMEEKGLLEELRSCFSIIDTLHQAFLSSGYQLEKLIKTVSDIESGLTTNNNDQNNK
ncbi:MAG TPA: alpha-amylase family glycosyl hydrolase [Syntrophorhabdaceae bacterium]|nr:alpha-amylase family glycosyl hydrolase [Syntrophorhabdaceae bacterium]